MNTCLLSIFLTVVPMEGVFLAPLQEGRDTVLIADQMLYGVEIKDVPEGTRLYFPEIQQKSPEEGGVMVLSDWQVDTLDVKRQKKGLPRLYDIRAGFVLTSFVEGEYQLPPLSVERHSPEGKVDTLEFAPLTFNVSPVLIDTTSFQIHDIKGQPSMDEHRNAFYPDKPVKDTEEGIASCLVDRDRTIRRTHYDKAVA